MTISGVERQRARLILRVIGRGGAARLEALAKVFQELGKEPA